MVKKTDQVEPVEETAETVAGAAPLPSPSPVDRGQMYIESHPTLGVTKTAHVVKQSIGDGRPGDGAEIVRS